MLLHRLMTLVWAFLIAVLVISGCAALKFEELADPGWGYRGEVQSGNLAGLKLVAIWPSRDICIVRRAIGQTQPSQLWLIEDECHRLTVTRVGSGDYWAFTFSGPPAGIFAVAYSQNDNAVKAACSRLRWSVSGRTSDCSRISVRYLE